MVYRLTHSALLLGLVAFFGQAPTSLIAPIAGVLVDRWDRHRVLVVTQVAAMLQSAALACSRSPGSMTVWHLMVLGAVQGVINAFDMPARQSFLRQMVDDRADLPNAIALNSSMVNVARLIGPAFAAVLVALVRRGLVLRDRRRELPRGDRVAARDAGRASGRRARASGRVLARDARRLALRCALPLVRAVLLLLAVSSVLGGAYTTLLPVVAARRCSGGPHTLGILMGAAGCGALCGALYLASRTTVVGLGA